MTQNLGNWHWQLTTARFWIIGPWKWKNWKIRINSKTNKQTNKKFVMCVSVSLVTGSTKVFKNILQPKILSPNQDLFRQFSTLWNTRQNILLPVRLAQTLSHWMKKTHRHFIKLESKGMNFLSKQSSWVLIPFDSLQNFIEIWPLRSMRPICMILD